MLVAFFLLQLR